MFKTIWRFVVVPAYPDHAVLRIKYNKTCFVFCKLLRLGNSGWNFFFLVAGRGGGGNFWFRGFGGFYFCLHSINPVTWNLEYPSWVLHRHGSSITLVSARGSTVNRSDWVFVATITHMSGSICVAGRIVFAQSSERRMHGFQNVSSPFSARPRSSSTKTLPALTIPLRVTLGYAPCEQFGPRKQLNYYLVSEHHDSIISFSPYGSTNTLQKN